MRCCVVFKVSEYDVYIPALHANGSGGSGVDRDVRETTMLTNNL